ncbi:MAG TPA: nitroreductase family protein [Candidatus Angelobacter sp.]|nr:nitroreductase family protein [Candidatus Angelobacter sp.]
MTTTTSIDILAALKNRRSIYGISKDVNLSNNRLETLLKDIVKYTPSAFNSQTTRLVLLLGLHHDKLWDITTDVLRAVVPEANFGSTAKKMASFKDGHGTVLFFEDQSIVESLQEQFPSYQENFPIWSQHTNAMHQLMVWITLENEGLGASLQHYNPLIDERVKDHWQLPETWKLIAQMPFGQITQQPGEKEFQGLDHRVKTFS